MVKQGRDISAILRGLVESGGLIVSGEGSVKLLEKLSEGDAPLLVAA